MVVGFITDDSKVICTDLTEGGPVGGGGLARDFQKFSLGSETFIFYFQALFH